jgi:DNA-binding response OmpR family regulator
LELAGASIAIVEDFWPGGMPGAIMQTIEVIENDPEMRALISEWLRTEGYGVHEISRIDDARARDVDLVVVNLENLHLDGADYVQRVKKIYATAALIGMSTQVSRTLAAGSERARRLGLARLISKPCRSSELLSAVADTIGLAADGI